ncbi:efflux transporter, outer membrane factor (OMF) lipoprotein, NodT family [Arachidicoccus rhizosphaerae]|uniref:Efflux transporter, outer membrane factor (OMF) lipoprotein, NodT family n=1 Tax=Arachidicoccus rhizosphaerae TaxID=551991 RepID=A0A1H3WY47_9BACT|nr:TolC family protein [Arachidicoccus rhizosphaerae]SDZ91262.1 efflux transporter, outer membrane factor (OMF) lipoprotein, NodT family [Arachidicoccus rhizosphaerae]
MHNKQSYFKILIFTGCLMIFWGGCKSVVKTYQSPNVEIDSLFRGNHLITNDSANIGSLHWKELFRDSLLQALIQEGIDNNLDLKVAYSRIFQAAAYLKQSELSNYPSLDADASIEYSKKISTSGAVSHVHQYSLGVDASWEADIWGKLKSAKKAQMAAVLSSEAAAQAIKTNLVASIARNYYSLMAYDKELSVTLTTVDTWKQTVKVMKDLKTGAKVTEAAVVQSEAELYATQVSVPDLKRNIRETENALCYLLGRDPGKIARDSLSVKEFIPLFKTGVPAEILAGRPDVREAELDFRQAFELTNVARTYFYPSLNITANGGLSSNDLSRFFSTGSLVGGIIGGLTQPIFNKRANKTRLEIAKQDQLQALYNFKQKLLGAGQEVSNALYSYRSATDKIAPRTLQLSSLHKAVDYTQELVRNDFADYSEVLIAMQSLLSAQINQVTDFLQRNEAIVNLYAAMGGGWQ